MEYAACVGRRGPEDAWHIYYESASCHLVPQFTSCTDSITQESSLQDPPATKGTFHGRCKWRRPPLSNRNVRDYNTYVYFFYPTTAPLPGMRQPKRSDRGMAVVAHTRLAALHAD